MGNFFNSLRQKWSGRQEALDLEKTIQSGDRVETVVANGSFQVLLEEVLDPLQQEAFAAFKKMDPSDIPGVIQTQKVAWVVDEIKHRVEKKIEAGRAARALKLQRTEEEVNA